MTRRRRALHLAPLMPARAGNGLAMRQGLFLEAMARQFDVRLVVLAVAGPTAAAPDLPDALGLTTTVIPTAGRADTHFALLSRLADPEARLAAFQRYGRNSLAAQVSAAVLSDLRLALAGERFDLVHIGRSYLADAMQAIAAPARVTLDLDEDEAASYGEAAALLGSRDPHSAAWAEAEAAAFSAHIAAAAPRIDRHFVSSPLDASWIGQRHPTLRLELVENAVALPAAPRRADDGRTLLFLGSYGYPPNVEAVAWFVESVWPEIRSVRGDVRLRLAGRDAGKLARFRDIPGIEITGEVASVADAYAAASLFVAPLLSGAGTRIKLLEAAAHRVPIVSSSIGARGLAFVEGQDLLIADRPDAFAAAVLATLADPETARRRAASAGALVTARYDRAQAVEQLACRLRDIFST